MGTESKKWYNKVVFWITLFVALGIISLTVITDICIIKKHCCSKSIEQITSTAVDKIPDVDYQISVTDSLTTNSKNETIPQSNNLDSLSSYPDHQTTTDGLVQDNNASNLQSYNLDSIVYYLTLAVDTVNNVLSGGAIALGILTLFLGLVGLFGFNTLKDDIDNKTKVFADNFNERITLIEGKVDKLQSSTEEKTESIETKFNDFINNYKSLVRSLNAQERYTNKSIKFLYEAIYMFLNSPGPDNSGIRSSINPNNAPDGDGSGNTNGNGGSTGGRVQEMLKDLYHKLQILKLYRCSLDEEEAKSITYGKKTALKYLEDSGTSEDLNDLYYAEQNEQNEGIKLRIREVIGIIKSKT